MLQVFAGLRRGKNNLDHALWRERSSSCDVLGSMMTENRSIKEAPKVLDVVALLADIPKAGLARGQVGTVVDLLDASSVLVEFNDDQGRAYAIEPCRVSELLLLHYEPEAA
jgi:hypothetical protein